MSTQILGIGYLPSEHKAVRHEWQRYGVDFRFTDSLAAAVLMLGKHDFSGISVFGDCLSGAELDVLRSLSSLSIVLMSADCSVEDRTGFLHGSSGVLLRAKLNLDADSVAYRDEQTDGVSQNRGTDLSIKKVGELCFCTELRSVEVRGRSIRLTPIEFAILAVLIAKPNMVHTFDMIAERVWHDGYLVISRKNMVNHVSNLRSKLRVDENVPNYIESVRCIGYRFNAD